MINLYVVCVSHPQPSLSNLYLYNVVLYHIGNSKSVVGFLKQIQIFELNKRVMLFQHMNIKYMLLFM